LTKRSGSKEKGNIRTHKYGEKATKTASKCICHYVVTRDNTIVDTLLLC